MDTKALEKFAQAARRQLTDQVTARLQLVLHGDSADLRARAEAVAKLRAEIKATSREAVIERVAYTWFNRFCALRFMDANRYTPLGIVSPALGNTQPEILQEAKAGQIDPIFPVDAARVLDLLSERIPSPDPQQEAYRLLVVAACNYYHGIMPFMFEPIADYTELLMPDDLLSANSVLHALREAMTEDACRDVEVIGWLYQFYISEKKDAVFSALRLGKKIATEEIPAATQLFTPHWIVRFVVENSLGRLWLLNRPTSKLANCMPFYIRPEQQETDFVQVASPEELRVCDPAVGSGHMLTYAFDLLYAIYEEEGYNPPDISRLILQKNLFGMEIDDRAGALAAFALTMKGRDRDSRFFRRHVRPNICVLHPVAFAEDELVQAPWVQAIGADLLDLSLRDAFLHDIEAFVLIDHVGSLLRPQLTSAQIEALRARISVADDLFTHNLNERVLSVFAQLDYLASSYHIVAANPPYMGSGGMNEQLKQFLSRNFSDVKSDLFSAFITRILEMTPTGGFVGMMTPVTWMFLSSYEALRTAILTENTISSLIRPEYNAFWNSAHVPLCTFTLFRNPSDSRGAFIDLQQFYGADVQPVKVVEGIANPDCGWSYRACAADFKKIPGSPIAFWFSTAAISNFEQYSSVSKLAVGRSGMSSSNSELFLRQWYEVSANNVETSAHNHSQAQASGRKWFPYNKGGGNRRWYGYNDTVINWYRDGAAIKLFVINNPKDPNTTHWSRRLFNLDYFFKSGITWSAVTSARFSMRIVPDGVIPGTGSKTIYDVTDGQAAQLLTLLNSCVAAYYLQVLSPTLNFEAGDVTKIPLIFIDMDFVHFTKAVVNLSKEDWNSYETSIGFTCSPLLVTVKGVITTLGDSYDEVRSKSYIMTRQLQILEQENNRVFIEAYNLQNELTPDVPLEEITLTCNPRYRYGGDRDEGELENLLLADTMREFISYAVGCMFGRYSLDKPGLILANQGETLTDYLRQVPNPTFAPDKDNVIPILAGDWFPDDAAERFKRFLRVTFGDEHFAENLAFVENAIGRDIRSYFLRDFYDHHLKMYQKRPIYWLFSSPKGSFNALIYMHRYRPDTVSVVLNDYLREFVAKLSARRAHLEQLRISAATPAADKTRALKELDGIDKTLAELTAYENEILYPLATQQVQIDLDDGVKVNYGKLGKALKKIPGLTE